MDRLLTLHRSSLAHSVLSPRRSLTRASAGLAHPVLPLLKLSHHRACMHAAYVSFRVTLLDVHRSCCGCRTSLMRPPRPAPLSTMCAVRQNLSLTSRLRRCLLPPASQLSPVQHSTHNMSLPKRIIKVSTERLCAAVVPLADLGRLYARTHAGDGAPRC